MMKSSTSLPQLIPKSNTAASLPQLSPSASVSSIPASVKVFKSNDFKSRSAAHLAQSIRDERLLTTPRDHPMYLKGTKRMFDPEAYQFKSKATTFAMTGIDWHGKQYGRDPQTGTWFKQNGQVFHATPGDTSFRVTQSKREDPRGMVKSMWVAPCGGNNVWVESRALKEPPLPEIDFRMSAEAFRGRSTASNFRKR